jgi:cation transporter-like permease
VDPDYVEACITQYTAFMDAISTAGWTWVIASRFSGVDPDTGDPIPRVAGVTTPVTNVVCTDATLDAQRRRLPGRGQ